eukprot:Skav232731  [mRNA]  locus=scaffold1843:118498:123479:- [translate_table: standard]
MPSFRASDAMRDDGGWHISLSPLLMLRRQFIRPFEERLSCRKQLSRHDFGLEMSDHDLEHLQLHCSLASTVTALTLPGEPKDSNRAATLRARALHLRVGDRTVVLPFPGTDGKQPLTGDVLSFIMEPSASKPGQMAGPSGDVPMAGLKLVVGPREVAKSVEGGTGAKEPT